MTPVAFLSKKTFLTGLLALLSLPALASVRVVTTTTDLAWAVKEIGQEHVSVESLLKGTEDPHFVDALPSFIHKAANADVVCVVGLDLEIGWAPKILTRTGKAEIQPGGPGYCEAGSSIQNLLEVPIGGVDRSMGDVHPRGNPHFWLSPDHFAEALVALSESLKAHDPQNAATFTANAGKLKEQLSKIKNKYAARLAALEKRTGPMPILQYHKELTYFMKGYGLKSAGSLEEVPGVAPSAGRIAQVASQAKAQKVKLLLAGEHAPRPLLQKFRELSGIPYAIVPTSIRAHGAPATYEELQEALVSTLEKNIL